MASNITSCIIKEFENINISILQDIGDVPNYYFRAADVGNVFNIPNIRASLQYYDADEKITREVATVTGIKATAFLSSQGVYKLLSNNQHPTAKKFKRWAATISNDIMHSYGIKLRKQLKDHEIRLHQQNNQIITQKKMLENSKIKELDLKLEIKNIELFKNNGYIYICTSKQYAKLNLFCIGKTMHLDTQMHNQELKRIKDTQFYYTYLYQCSNVKLLEVLLKKLLFKYKDNDVRDTYIMSFNVLKTYVENICKIFNENIMSITDQMNDDAIRYNNVGQEIDPFVFVTNDIDSEIAKSAAYYDQIVDIYKNYAGVIIHTMCNEVSTIFDIVDIQCPHFRRRVQAHVLINTINCNICLQDKIVVDKTKKMLGRRIENYNNYNYIEIFSDTSFDFVRLKPEAKKIKIIQNIIVRKLALQEIKLLTKYRSLHAKISYICIYGHRCNTSYASLKKLDKNLCKKCLKIKLEIEKIHVPPRTSSQYLQLQCARFKKLLHM